MIFSGTLQNVNEARETINRSLNTNTHAKIHTQDLISAAYARLYEYMFSHKCIHTGVHSSNKREQAFLCNNDSLDAKMHT